MKGFGGPYKSKKKKIKNNVSQENIIKLATNFHLQGNIKEAAKYYQYLVNQRCINERVFSNYGIILRDQGKLKDAEIYTRKAIKLNPDLADSHSNLGNILRDQGKLQDAEFSYRRAIEIKPDFAQAHYNLGNIFKDQSKLQDAEFSYRRAIEIKPDFAQAHYNLGNIFRDQSKLQNAEFSYRRAIEIKPDFANAYFSLFRHFEQINNLEKLKESLDEFKKINIVENERILFNARLSFRNKDYQAAKESIDNIAPEWIEKTNNIQKTIFWNFKAFIEDKVGNYDIAYTCFENSQKDQAYEKLNKDSYLDFINSYQENIINKKTVFYKFNDEIEDSNLAFLIGFPRSGTTLLDTILRSHKDIEVIEEKPLISTIEKIVKEKLNTKLCNISDISKENIIILRQQYFKLLNRYKTKNANLFIDKLPLNTVSLPLINLIFPKAKIIFTHRHPYDTVLSCFQQSFKPNIAMANLVSLQSSSIMYDRVMFAWDIYKKNLYLDFVTSKYEDLIEDFDNHIKKLLVFLGINWDENLKKYRMTAIERGKINTPSSSQVVQPLYKTSIKKWKNYENYFEDCHQYLEKWISYFNY